MKTLYTLVLVLSMLVASATASSSGIQEDDRGLCLLERGSCFYERDGSLFGPLGAFKEEKENQDDGLVGTLVAEYVTAGECWCRGGQGFHYVDERENLKCYYLSLVGDRELKASTVTVATSTSKRNLRDADSLLSKPSCGEKNQKIHHGRRLLASTGHGHITLERAKRACAHWKFNERDGCIAEVLAGNDLVFAGYMG